MRLFKSFGYAFRGIYLLLKSEKNFQIHIVALCVVVIAGFYFDIHRAEWALILLTSGMVLGFEAINSSLEKLCDEVTGERKETIRNIKDIAAGAVLISAIMAVVIAVLIFGERVVGLF